jgi:tetratricopeptide (TPR) repeat protein
MRSDLIFGLILSIADTVVFPDVRSEATRCISHPETMRIHRGDFHSDACAISGASPTSINLNGGGIFRPATVSFFIRIAAYRENYVMSYLCLLLFFALIAAPAMRGESNVHQQLVQAFNLERQGQFDQAIRQIQPLVESHALSPGESGRAWTLLGYAYQAQWNVERAQDAYEQAVRVLEGDAQHVGDYANALDFFSGLYALTGQRQMAAKMLTKALSIREKEADHRGMARSYSSLAGLEVAQKHIRAAKSAMARAFAESRLTNDLTDDDHAFLSDTQAWLASVDGDKNLALAGFQSSLDIMRRSHGEDDPLTGFAHLLVGKAYAANKQFNEALTNIREGISILNRTTGPQSPRYLQGQLLYAEVLDRSGMHAEASRIKGAAEQSLKALSSGQCIGCTISVASLGH